MKGATPAKASLRMFSSVSIHAPVKGATAQRRSSARESSSFNSRSREGSDAYEGELTLTQSVSIHAPVKGATVEASVRA